MEPGGLIMHSRGISSNHCPAPNCSNLSFYVSLRYALIQFLYSRLGSRVFLPLAVALEIKGLQNQGIIVIFRLTHLYNHDSLTRVQRRFEVLSNSVACRPRWSRGNVLDSRSKVRVNILSTSPPGGTLSWGSRV